MIKTKYIKPAPVTELSIFLGKTITKYGSNPIITGGSRDAGYTNLCPAGTVTDPLDSSKWLMLVSEFTGPTTIAAQISLYIGNNSDPYSLTAVDLVLEGSVGTDDVNGCRFGGDPVFYDGLWYYFYVGISADFKWRIFKASTEDFRSFTKLGLALDFNDTDEKSLSGPTVYIDDDGIWHMIYTAWDGIGSYPNNNPGASAVGMKHAYSDDNGATWTKTGVIVIPMGGTNAYNEERTEDGVLYKFGESWAVPFTGLGGPGSNIYRVLLATGPGFDRPLFPNSQPYIDIGTASEWDKFITACAFYRKFPSGAEVFYYQGTDTNDGYIHIGAATLS